MPDLIPISQHQIASETKETFDARELHVYLEVQKRYSVWIKAQIQRARLVENQDYIVYVPFGTALESKAYGDSKESTPEYHLTLDAGKHIGMISGTAKGFEVREYFIECERKAVDGHATLPTIPNHWDVLAQIVDLGKQQARQIAALEATQATQAATLTAIQDRQPPEGKMTVRGFLKRYSKPFLPKELLDALKYYCRQAEKPELFRPDGFDYADSFYSLQTLHSAYAEATRQLTFLAHARSKRAR